MKIYIGKIISTHGIKGEIKIKSNFLYKEEAFKIGNELLIDDSKYIINSYRRHKDYDMVTLNGYTNINDILFLMKRNVYIDKNNLCLDDKVLDEELINYKAIIGDKVGKILEIFYASKTNKIIRILLDNKEILVPYNEEFIKKIDKNNNEVYIKLIDGMII